MLLDAVLPDATLIAGRCRQGHGSQEAWRQRFLVSAASARPPRLPRPAAQFSQLVTAAAAGVLVARQRGPKSGSLARRDGECGRKVPDAHVQMMARASAPVLPKLTADEQQQLGSGKQVQCQVRQGHFGWGFVVDEIAAPPSLVLSCLSSFENYPDIIPVVRSATVASLGLSSTGLLTVSAFYRLSKFWLGVPTVHTIDPGSRTVTFDLDPKATGSHGLVLREATGYWHVEESGSGSRVWLSVKLRAASLLPHWFVDYAAERALRRATNRLKPYVEETWKQRQQQAAAPIKELDDPSRPLPFVRMQFDAYA